MGRFDLLYLLTKRLLLEYKGTPSPFSVTGKEKCELLIQVTA
jgi:hypothetical protein